MNNSTKKSTGTRTKKSNKQAAKKSSKRKSGIDWDYAEKWFKEKEEKGLLRDITMEQFEQILEKVINSKKED